MKITGGNGKGSTRIAENTGKITPVISRTTIQQPASQSTPNQSGGYGFSLANIADALKQRGLPTPRALQESGINI